MLYIGDSKCVVFDLTLCNVELILASPPGFYLFYLFIGAGGTWRCPLMVILSNLIKLLAFGKRHLAFDFECPIIAWNLYHIP